MADGNANKKEVIHAAGGLVWREEEQGKELLVIHRERYDDWTLPKGKQKVGEELLETALREIKEETGYRVNVERFAGATTYEVDGTPKVVSFWQMVPTGEPADELDDEVSEAVWLPVDQAWERLQYPLEKALVDIFRSEQQPVQHKAPAGLLGRLLNYRRRLSISHRRLRQELAHLREEHAYLCSLPVAPPPDAEVEDVEAGEPAASHGPWWSRADVLLWQAGRALEDLDLELAWSCLKGASRFTLYGLAERKPARLRSRARAALREAQQKLTGWRQETVVGLLAGPDGQTLRDDLPVEHVVQAVEILDGHHDNVYQRLDILKKRLRNLTLVMGLVWLVWMAITWVAVPGPANELLGTTLAGWRFWGTVSALGLMGALLSIFISIRTRAGKSRIPIELADNWVTVARLGIAVLTAIMAVILLHSQIINLGLESAQLTWAVALAAGFSERLVVRALEQVAE